MTQYFADQRDMLLTMDAICVESLSSCRHGFGLVRLEMIILIDAALAFCIVASLLHVASAVVVLGRVCRNRTAPSPTMNVAVSIVRPLCGIENFSELTLRSTFQLDYSRYEVVFCVASPSDPVIPLVRRLIDEYPHIASRFLIGNDRISDNPKLNNVVKGWDAAEHAWLVMADSNVPMPTDYLHRLLGAWRRDTGLVSSPAVGCCPDGAWAELECAFLNTYQVRWQCFADTIGIGFAQGKTLLFHKQVLQAAGGVRSLATELAEDAAAIRDQGLRVRVVDRPFSQPLGKRTAAEVWRRQLRWARLRRETFILYFLPELLAGGVLPIAAFGVLDWAYGWPFISSLLAFTAGWYGTETLLAGAAGWHLSWASPAAWLLRDLLIPVLWLTSWLGNDFVWRDTPMRVADRGSAA